MPRNDNPHMNGGDNFRRVRVIFNVYEYDEWSHPQYDLMVLNRVRSFFQQFFTGLNFSRIFAEMQHSAKFTARVICILPMGLINVRLLRSSNVQPLKQYCSK